MSQNAKFRTGAKLSAVLATVAIVAACSSEADTGNGSNGSSGDEVTLELAQWWATELPDGSFRAIVDRFEEENPGIKVELNSQPYANTRDQLVAGAASGTMPDVMGLDGNWIYDFHRQGALADLSEIAGDDYAWDLVNPIDVDGGTYMIPAVNFAYVMFANDDLLAEAGVTEFPETWDEFSEAAQAVNALDDTISGWALPLSLESAVGVKNDVMSWVWGSGGSMLTESGEPNLTGEKMAEALQFLSDLNDTGAIAPGVANMQEQDKVEEFGNGRVGFIISSLAHINLLAENEGLNFSIGAVPTQEGFSGTPGVTFASWGIGIAENTEHKEEAWKLVEFLLEADVNAELSGIANAFPGNSNAEPEHVTESANSQAAFDVWQASTPMDEFIGVPVSEQLMRTLAEQAQRVVNGDTDVASGLETAQATWEDLFAEN